MTETISFLRQALEENWIHARQAEEKRATLANVVLVLASTTIIAIAFIGLSSKTLLLTLLLMLLGVYGIATTMKLYERSQYHILRARKLRARLDKLCPDAQVEQTQKTAEVEHQAKYPRLMHIRLNSIWLGFYAFLIVVGMALAIMSVL